MNLSTRTASRTENSRKSQNNLQRKRHEIYEEPGERVERGLILRIISPTVQDTFLGINYFRYLFCINPRVANSKRKRRRSRERGDTAEAAPQDDDDEGDDGVPAAAPEQDGPRPPPLLSLGVGHSRGDGGRRHVDDGDGDDRRVVVGVGGGVGGQF